MYRAEQDSAAAPRLRWWILAAVAVAAVLVWQATEVRSLRGELERERARRTPVEAAVQAEESRDPSPGSASERPPSTAEPSPEEPAAGVRLAATSGPAPPVQSRTAPLVASLVLAAGVRADVDVPVLELPPAAEVAELRVDLESDDGYGGFRAVVATLAGAEVWSAADLAARNGELVLRLRAELFDGGLHELVVEGLDGDGEASPIGFYTFSVTRG